jgi:hypothetical protein
VGSSSLSSAARSNALAAEAWPPRRWDCQADASSAAAISSSAPRGHHPVPERAVRAMEIRERLGQRRVDLPPPERGDSYTTEPTS